MRDAASALLSASDQQTHAALGTRGLARAKVEFADGLASLRRALEKDAGKGFLAPAVADDVQRYFTATDVSPEQKRQLKQSIVRAMSVEP
jgi:hypothetical protein